MRGMTQIAMVIGCIIMLLGFLQTRDESDRLADLLAQFEKKCIPTHPGERAVAEWINGRLTCISFEGNEYGQALRVTAVHHLSVTRADLPQSLFRSHEE